MKKFFFTTPLLKDVSKFFDDSRAGRSRSFATDRAHTKIKRNDADPDDGNSWLCSACKLPIFSTPYTTNPKDDNAQPNIFLHEQCANLPEKLEDSELHPEEPLFLRVNTEHTTCSVCSEECGSKLYYCPDPCCGLQLDVACATTVKISHISHEHRLMAIRGAEKLVSLICGACGTNHPLQSSSRTSYSYLCNVCSYWIHPDCTSLPVNIKHKHKHALILDYYRRDKFGLKSSTSSSLATLAVSVFRPHHDPWRCAVCGKVIKSLGAYSCMTCSHHLHIRCAVKDPEKYDQRLTRNMNPSSERIWTRELPGLVHLPVPDEHTSMIRYVKESSGTSSSDEHELDNLIRRSQNNYLRENNIYAESLRDQIETHQHQLTFYGKDDGEMEHPDARCIVCAKIISPPFYSCSTCPYPEFFIHDCCYDLPIFFFPHPAHNESGGHVMFLKQLENPTDIGQCSHCMRPHTGFSYSCVLCNDFDMDVVCGMMPTSITHGAHSKTHILYITPDAGGGCYCCGKPMEKPSYACQTCHNFALHTWCAMLPDTVRLHHKFDQHPLKLITDGRSVEEAVCEICEKGDGIDGNHWYYSCAECSQSFHIECLDYLSNVRIGATVRVARHDCPLTLVRGSTLRGYRCGGCEERFEDDLLALECSDCCFWIHLYCAMRQPPT